METWPRRTIFALAGVCAGFAPFWTALLWTEGCAPRDPLWHYYQLPGIRVLCIGAVLLDFILLAALWRWFVSSPNRWHGNRPRLEVFVCVCSLLLALLPWLELWYGADTYYGEVRDKQGLPWTVNHIGPLGSFIFLTAAAWAVPLSHRSKAVQLASRIGATAALGLVTLCLTYVLAEPLAY